MKCSHCFHELPGALPFCPICGTRSDFQTAGPSFERTWADIARDELKKHPSQKAFDKALQAYLQDLALHPEDTLDVFRFLEDHSQYQADLSALPFSAGPFDTYRSIMEPGYQLLLYGVSKLDGPSIYQLLKSNPNLRLPMRMFFKTQTLPPVLEPLSMALNEQYENSRLRLREVLEMPLDAPLVLEDPFAFKVYSGLSSLEKNRANAIFTLRQQEDIDGWLEQMYRPMAGNEDPFAHLAQIGPNTEEFLQRHKDRWKEKTLEYLGNDTCLRGIHLCLQTIKGRFFSLAQDCDELLARQFEKAYLRPYAEIEATDYQFVDGKEDQQ